MMRNWDLSQIFQVDFDLFYHQVGQVDTMLEVMVEQISQCLVETLKEEGTSLTDRDVDDIISKFEQEALNRIPKFRNIFDEIADKCDFAFGFVPHSRPAKQVIGDKQAIVCKNCSK